MRSHLAPVALAALAAANPVPQGVTAAISPDTPAPAGCQPSYDGRFQIQVVNVSATSTKRSHKRQSGALYLHLADGILTDADGRTGYIAANRQFQFDKPAQTGAIYTAGWSACANNTLAIGGDAVFQQCLSGTFYNLYDEATAAQCSPVYIEIVKSGSSSGSGAPAASQLSDGQVTATPVSPVSQISDGQIQATTGNPVSQISDGQIQGPTGAPVQQISDGQVQATTGAPISQISDGQVQAPTSNPAAPVTQISDGQVQAPTNGSAVATATPPVHPYTGAAATPALKAEIALAGLLGALVLGL